MKHTAGQGIAEAAAKLERAAENIFRAGQAIEHAADAVERAVLILTRDKSLQAIEPAATLAVVRPKKTPNRNRVEAQERRARALELYGAATPLHKIAAELGISMGLLRADLLRSGVKRLPRTYRATAERRDKVMEMYDAKLGTPAEIADALGIAEATVVDDIGVRLAERALAPGAAK